MPTLTLTPATTFPITSQPQPITARHIGEHRFVVASAQSVFPLVPGDVVETNGQLEITTITQLQPGFLVYGDAPTNTTMRQVCELGPVYFFAHWPETHDIDTVRRILAAQPIHHYVHMSQQARLDALLCDTDVALADSVLASVRTTSPMHMVTQQQPSHLFLNLLEAHRAAYPELAELFTQFATSAVLAWVAHSPDATLLRRTMSQLGLLSTIQVG
ncbi:MAG: hypothetical protein Q4A82_02400 [Corynebacterium sp.]|nr:hypothetical protein [Corynebacterium sp.]